MHSTENTEHCFKMQLFPLFFTIQRKNYAEDKYYCFVSEYLVFLLISRNMCAAVRVERHFYILKIKKAQMLQPHGDAT
jgi:hypothetical protein